MTTRTLHFTIGENAGILLMQIAHEHLSYGLNPKKAVETITGSLIGCPMDMALDILIGDKVIEVDVKEQCFNVVDRNELIHSDFPKFDPLEWHKREHEKIGNNARNLYEFIGDNLRQRLSPFGGFEKEFYIESIIEFINGNPDSVLHELESDFAIKEIKDLVLATKRFLEAAELKYQVMEWLICTYPKCFSFDAFSDPDKYYSTDRHQAVDMLGVRLRNLIGKNVKSILNELKNQDDEIRNFISTSIDITKKLSDKIKPNPIEDLNDASWIAPNGDHYGLNGTIANMLHIQLADKLQEDGIVVVSNSDMKADTFMRREGWITIHNGWVLFDGYYHGKEVTPEQLHALYLFGQHYALRTKKMPVFGTEKVPVTGARLQMMDGPAIKKLFDFFSR